MLCHRVGQDLRCAHLTAALSALRSARAAERDAPRLAFWTVNSRTRPCRAPIWASAEARDASREAAFLLVLQCSVIVSSQPKKCLWR